jgi:hypothetical protein
MDDELIPATIEPALTPNFLAYLADLERRRPDPERPDVSWTILLCNTPNQDTSKLTPSRSWLRRARASGMLA